ncbi:MAG: glycosyltransferase family 9 protein [Candidatus Omnitrophica bacterium]|nr:glycosyltransferase family 9 protein [Candidatus Omnitrophota bacterium]MBU1926115.1 glycosyltransferase family 9 protein [Candidatus Omnitrophota bacterium]
MKIKLMRRLDYWVGIPVCFLLTVLKNVSDLFLFGRKTNPDRINKIVFLKLSELGAIILSYPLILKMKQAYPESLFFFVTFSKNKDVFKALNNIIPEENILVIREDNLFAFIADVFLFIKRIRREKIDIIFDLEFFSRVSAVISYLCAAKRIAGFYAYTFEGLYRGNLLTHKVAYNPLRHITKSYLSLAQAIKGKGKYSPELLEAVRDDDIILPRYKSQSVLRRKMEDKILNAGLDLNGKIILLNPGEGVLPLREWPLNYFVSLCRFLLGDEKYQIIFIGTKGASAKTQEILRILNSKRCLDLVGHTKLEELMELFYIANALICNDCGLAHLAALAPIHSYIIFGPESPRIFSPFGKKEGIIYSNWPCSPCISALNHRDSACRDNVCLKEVLPEQVYGLVKQSISEN